MNLERLLRQGPLVHVDTPLGAGIALQEVVEAIELSLHNLSVDNVNVVLNGVTVSANGIRLDATKLSKPQCGARFKTHTVRAIHLPQLGHVFGGLTPFEGRHRWHTGRSNLTLFLESFQLLGLHLVGKPQCRSVSLTRDLGPPLAIVHQLERTVALRELYAKLIDLIAKLVDLRK